MRVLFETKPYKLFRLRPCSKILQRNTKFSRVTLIETPTIDFVHSKIELRDRTTFKKVDFLGSIFANFHDEIILSYYHRTNEQLGLFFPFDNNSRIRKINTRQCLLDLSYPRDLTWLDFKNFGRGKPYDRCIDFDLSRVCGGVRGLRVNNHPVRYAKNQLVTPHKWATRDTTGLLSSDWSKITFVFRVQSVAWLWRSHRYVYVWRTWEMLYSMAWPIYNPCVAHLWLIWAICNSSSGSYVTHL